MLEGAAAFQRRLRILWETYREHRFERRSPIPTLPEETARVLYDHEIVFPPRTELMQPGMQTIEGLFALGALARHVGARTLFEIGTYKGLTAWFLARNTTGSTVNTLDIPPESDPSLPTDKSDEFRAARNGMFYSRRPAPGEVVQHWGDSAVFDFSPWAGLCCMVYIDGAHSPDYVRRDSEHAFAMVRAGGVIVWDDYWHMAPGVAEVLHGLLERDIPLLRIPGTRLVVHFSGHEEHLGNHLASRAHDVHDASS